jgi:hypothetical protein
MSQFLTNELVNGRTPLPAALVESRGGKSRGELARDGWRLAPKLVPPQGDALVQRDGGRHDDCDGEGPARLDTRQRNCAFAHNVFRRKVRSSLMAQRWRDGHAMKRAGGPASQGRCNLPDVWNAENADGFAATA